VVIEVETEIAELYEQYMEGIYCFCICKLKIPNLAEEATSEVFLKFVEKYLSLKINGQKKKTEARVRNWLYGAAKNAISHQIRQANRHKTNLMDVANTKVDCCENERNLNERPEREILCRAISRLNTKDQQIIIHRFWKGSHTSDIAEMLGMEHGAVRVRLSRAIRTLRKNMGLRYV
jgi:RNA polymerase sigma factor (sigma-70 family)